MGKKNKRHTAKKESEDNTTENQPIPKKKGCRRFFSKGNLLISVLLVLFMLQYIQMQRIFGNVSFLEGRDTSLITEIGQIKEAYLSIGEDMNEVREFLRMPTNDYSGFDDSAAEVSGEDDEAKNENDVQIALFQYVDYLSITQKMEEELVMNLALIESLDQSEHFVIFLGEMGLSLTGLVENDEGYELHVNTVGGQTLVSYVLSNADGKLYQRTVKGEEELKYADAATLYGAVQVFIQTNKDDLLATVEKIEVVKADIVAAILADEAQRVIGEKGLTLTTDSKENGAKISWDILGPSDDLVGEIVFDQVTMKISLVDKKESSMSLEVTDVLTGLAPFLQKLDTQSFIEKKADETLSELQQTILDQGFQLLLSESGFTISQEPQEDDERYYFEISSNDGEVVSMLVVEKMTGVINIVQPDGANPENLLFFDPEFKKKTLEIPDVIPTYDEDLAHDDGSFNILIAGKHGNLVDTMIFAHIDEERGDVRMISVPRDLFYNGRKINSLAFYYGMPELKKVLSDMTGYELDKYILIDMYAFIDMIDLIGGVDVHLDRAVIDPTYRTVDNGVEGTLHYEPGDYHLGGVEALRLARSRHTSSDFARAERQQLIIESIQDKAQNFGFGDADTIYEIAKTVLAETETDISIDDAIAYYFRYQNLEIVSNNVMSSGNVLYVPPYITVSNCQKAIAAAQAAGQGIPGCMNDNHAYTLSPKDNNWNIVKWYFRENFDGA